MELASAGSCLLHKVRDSLTCNVASSSTISPCNKKCDVKRIKKTVTQTENAIVFLSNVKACTLYQGMECLGGKWKMRV